MEYQPLNSSRNEIRLLTLHPLSKAEAADENNVVRCDIEHYPLIQENPSVSDTISRFRWGDYAALSYVWGDSTPVKEIIVGERKVTVRTNLEAALRVLSHGPEVKNAMKF
jgi:hypothetical protein